MKVNLFFRKHTSGFRSIEELFGIVISRLNNVECNIVEVPEKKISFRGIYRNQLFAFRNRGDVNHITGDIHYIALMTGRKTVLTIHDANSVIAGKWYKKIIVLLFWFWLPALLVKRITTISEKSRRELEKFIPFAKHKISVIPNPYNPKLLKGNPEQDEDKITNTAKPIILHLGTKSNKNLERTIEALAGLPYKLYVIGKLSDHQVELLAKHHIDFRSYFNLPYSEVALLYHQCTAVCFASLYEGFGMPIIEAQLVGKPVVTSNVDPMPWVAGENGACLIDPFDINSIRKGLIKVIENESYRKGLIKNGLENVQRFDPVKIAKMYEKVYREVLD